MRQKFQKVLNRYTQKELNEKFWHEKNSLFFVDKLETLPAPNGEEHNLNLTYAVRDGIVLHCGEIDENNLKPRNDVIDLENIKNENAYSPYTWEGCVVKISDKIAYLGRDIEDAITLRVLPPKKLKELKKIIKEHIQYDFGLEEINNTVLMHDFVVDLCAQSNLDDGIKLSDKFLQLLNSIKEFNYENIYLNARLGYFKSYAKLVIESIYDALINVYNSKKTIERVRNIYKRDYPSLIGTFPEWLIKYSNIDELQRKNKKYKNDMIYDISNQKDYSRAIIHYISGMTDIFAIKVFKELTSF